MTKHFSRIDDDRIVELFSQMRLDSSGLEEVSIAVKAGNFTAAEEAYLRHYRTRRQPVLDWGRGGSFENNSSGWDFLFPKPEIITWRDQENMRSYIHNKRGYSFDRSQGYCLTPYTLLNHADMLLKNQVFIPSCPEDGIQNLGTRWDWEHLPQPGGSGRRWPMSLVYQYFLRALAQAYWLTDQENYISKVLEISTDYVVYLPNKSDWMWIPDMQLSLNYQQLMPYLLSWNNLAPRDFCTIQYFLSGPCAKSMESVTGAPGNQLMHNGRGLFWIGVGMPEFKAATRWRERGLQQISDYFLDAASYPDGSSKENSYGYVVGTAMCGFETLKMVRGNHLAPPEGMEESMMLRAEFLAFTAKPDGSYVWTGDSTRGSGLPYVKAIAETQKRDDLLFVATSKKYGKAPAHCSVYYSWAGVGIMRSNWEMDSNYLFFDVGPFGVVHGHEAKLAIEVVSYGRSLVEDLGIHTYGRDPRDEAWTKFFSETSGHNTVLVDSKGQMRKVVGPRTVDKPLSYPWQSSHICDYLVGEYEEGYGPSAMITPRFAHHNSHHRKTTVVDTSVVHRRSVIFVKARQVHNPEYWIVTDWLIGRGDHSCDQLFHLIPTSVSIDEVTRTVRTTSPGSALAFLPVEKVELNVVEGRLEPNIQGWYCGTGGDGRPVPAPCIIFSRSGALPTMIQTVLWPMRSESNELPQVETLAKKDSGWVKVTLPDGSVDLYCSPMKPGWYEDDGISFEGTACLVRLDAQGLHSWELLQGTSLVYKGESLAG